MNGHKISGDLVRDIQGVDNIEALDAFRIYNAWLSFSGSTSGAKVGIIDLNSEFDVHNVAAVFVNSSFGIGPEVSHSGLNGPSIYPNSGLGVVAWIDDADRDIRYRVGAFDGVPNDPNRPSRTSLSLSARQGALLIAEADKSWATRNRIVVGAWGYTSALPQLTNPSRSGQGSVGVYATLEATVFERGDGRRLDGWVRAGWSNPTYNIVSAYVGGGLVYRGVFAGPKVDSLGVAIAYADLSRGMSVVSGAVPGAGVAGSGAETTLELTYQRHVRDWLTIQPDLQYVLSPAGRADVPDALVLGARVTLSVN